MEDVNRDVLISIGSSSFARGVPIAFYQTNNGAETGWLER
jgi:hypothetical protein